MRTCTTYTPTGPSIVLAKSLPFDQRPEDPGRHAAAILGHALRLFEPLAVDLRLALRLSDEPFLDEEISPAHGSWHVRLASLADERRVRPAFERAGHVERRVPAIDAETIDRIAAEAILQPAPRDRLVTLSSLQVTHVRARLLDPELASAGSLRVARGRFEHEVRIARDGRGAWIDEVPDPLDRPLQLAVDNNDGAVRAKLTIAWSLWKEDGSPEHAAVVDFARQVLAGGFELESASPEFRGRLPP